MVAQHPDQKQILVDHTNMYPAARIQPAPLTTQSNTRLPCYRDLYPSYRDQK